MSTDVHAIDDLVKALCKGDPNELVPLDVVTAMATAAIQAHWIECPHADSVTETNHYGSKTSCQRCGVTLATEGDIDAWMKPEPTNG